MMGRVRQSEVNLRAQGFGRAKATPFVNDRVRRALTSQDETNCILLQE